MSLRAPGCFASLQASGRPAADLAREYRLPENSIAELLAEPLEEDAGSAAEAG